MGYEEKLEEIQSYASRYIKSIAMDIIVVIVAVAYVFYQMITLEPTDLNPLVLLAGAAMSIICGVVIKQALGENGFSRGYNSKTWNDEEKLYNDACNTANPYMEYVDNFYQYEEIEKKLKYRRTKLQGVRLRYNDWFDEDGYYIGTKERFDRLDRKQKRVVKKCIKVKIYPLNLFSQYSISADQDTKQEITDSKKRTSNIAKNAISATLIAIIGVYFMPMLKSWSWASFIAATMQVALWVLFGIIQLYQNFNFIVQDKVAILRKKKEEIKKFTSGCKNRLYDHSPYETKTKESQDKELIEKIQEQPILPMSNNTPVEVHNS